MNRKERALLLRALVFLPLVELLLATLGFKRCLDVVHWLARRHVPRRRPGCNDLDEARATARAVDIAGAYGFRRSNCLTRSLTLLVMIGRRGIPAELRIGTRKNGGQLEAHAWVEQSGIPLNETADIQERYFVFDDDLAVLSVQG